MDNPYILEETKDFAVIYKPPKMHCTAINNLNRKDAQKSNAVTLYEWYSNQSVVFDIMHRLDYETHGLVLFAKNENSYEYFKSLQDKGEFIKEYSSVCIYEQQSNNPSLHTSTRAPAASYSTLINGYPQLPLINKTPSLENPSIIKSYFRPFGPGRKLVRPVIDDAKKNKEIAKDKGGFYITEIISINNNIFTMRIKRGFRHQIRCHLSWIGRPILNDPLYSIDNDEPVSGNLSLKAHALYFTDPADGRRREYKISPLI
ncbi:MAG: pseudouridine synthase [Treponema sp.]|nr:pseudouridine synthase [Treponema sp.]